MSILWQMYTIHRSYMGIGFAPRVSFKNQALFNDNRMGGIQLRQSVNNIKGKNMPWDHHSTRISQSLPEYSMYGLFTVPTFRVVLVVCLPLHTHANDEKNRCLPTQKKRCGPPTCTRQLVE